MEILARLVVAFVHAEPLDDHAGALWGQAGWLDNGIAG